MDYKKRFYKHINETFIPLLRQDGFKGSGQNFRRVKGDVIHTINLQNNKYGGSCCLNVGVHFTFLPVCWDSKQMPNLNKIKEVDSEFRFRVAPEGKSDYWWKFRGNGLFGSTKKSVEHLCETYKVVGRAIFSRYGSVESVQEAFPLEIFESEELSNIEGGIIPSRVALALARINQHIGNKDQQQKYARVGLRVSDKDSGLKIELEQLAE
ncbi:DUF4304 domain-containing protein [Kangiella aquimarina]|uniref:DUF4304 domain-containing protein n=1 Tax=Kangiella aquimarina TaxID=261965 RepID=A0ABZ0X4R3_9GAMM|nr:DUF4304 domain-containing protein [Kangiella aquimarina]WQG85596.1 DUF4304 domain-containing protein [Kangiella aquimarina]